MTNSKGRITTGVSLPPAILEWLRAESEKTGLSVSYLVKLSVEKYKKEVEGNE